MTPARSSISRALVRSCRSAAVLLAICLGPTPVFAGEIRILDYFGLVRAVSTVPDRADVEMTTAMKGKEPPSTDLPLLTQRSGIAADIIAEQIGENTFIFRQVGVGVWRVRLRDKNLSLISVRILDTPGPR